MSGGKRSVCGQERQFVPVMLSTGLRSCYRQQASQRVLSMAGAILLRALRTAEACLQRGRRQRHGLLTVSPVLILTLLTTYQDQIPRQQSHSAGDDPRIRAVRKIAANAHASIVEANLSTTT